MRIIGGRFKGRRFHPPADNWPTRPTTDYAKEALFNILTNRFDFTSMIFLDLFGGTGSHSIEAISRGCCDVTYVDKFHACVRYIGQLVRELEVGDCIAIHRADVFRFCKKATRHYDYIFAGPPYALPGITAIPDMILTEKLLKPGGLFILEHNNKTDLSGHPNLLEVRKYGQCHFSLFSNAGDLT